MSLLEAALVVLAGVAAGTINVVVGSGTLITFPTLLAVGLPPVVANVSNNIGLVPGSVAGSIGYRRELAGQRARALRLGLGSLVGGLTGAALLLVLPDDAFRAIVPVFIALAVLLVVLGPRLSARVAARRAGRPPGPGSGRLAWLGVLGAGVYGGYFGAAQGIMLLGVLGVTLDEDLQRINALKNVLATVVNVVAGIVFVAVADVAWDAAALVAAGAVAGGVLGARYGRRLPPEALRGLVVVVGVVAIVRLLST